jgi:hypothetical protein
MNRREERWGSNERWRGDDEWQRYPGSYESDEREWERGGWRGREYGGDERTMPGRRQFGGYGGWDGEYRGQEDRRYGRGNDETWHEPYPSGRRGMRHGGGEGNYRGDSYDDGRVQWGRREPDRDPYGAREGDYESGAGYGSGYGYGEYGRQGSHQAGSARLSRYARHGNEDMQGPYSGIGPKGYQRSTERLREEVCDRLQQHGQIDASDIDVRVEEGGTVVLTGTVDSRQAKRLAEDLAEDVMGVKDVANQIRIRDREQRSQGEPGGSGYPGSGSSRTTGQESSTRQSRSSASTKTGM